MKFYLLRSRSLRPAQLGNCCTYSVGPASWDSIFLRLLVSNRSWRCNRATKRYLSNQAAMVQTCMAVIRAENTEILVLLVRRFFCAVLRLLTRK